MQPQVIERLLRAIENGDFTDDVFIERVFADLADYEAAALGVAGGPLANAARAAYALGVSVALHDGIANEQEGSTHVAVVLSAMYKIGRRRVVRARSTRSGERDE